jgi:nucleoside-diphosphate-sugar epimerase
LIQLVSTVDYLRATEAAILTPGAHGIYHVGDEQPVTLQHFLDEACDAWGYPRPLRVPVGLAYLAASLCELFASVAGTKSPLTRDFIRLGRVSHWGDTRRAREELIQDLVYPTLASGRATL